MDINKDKLIEDIAEQLCENVDEKTLLQLYYDNQVEYMSDMDDEDLLSWADNYLYLSKDEVLATYKN